MDLRTSKSVTDVIAHRSSDHSSIADDGIKACSLWSDERSNNRTEKNIDFRRTTVSIKAAVKDLWPVLKFDTTKIQEHLEHLDCQVFLEVRCSAVGNFQKNIRSQRACVSRIGIGCDR